MILGERWEGLLDDPRIGDPRIGAELMSMHENITVELLQHLGCWVDRTLEMEGWVAVTMPSFGPGPNAPIWMPTYTTALPFPRIEGSRESTEEERSAFDAGGNERLRALREMVRQTTTEAMALARERGEAH